MAMHPFSQELLISFQACPFAIWMIVPESFSTSQKILAGQQIWGPNTLEKEVSNMTLFSRLKEGGERFLQAELTPPDQ